MSSARRPCRQTARLANAAATAKLPWHLAVVAAERARAVQALAEAAATALGYWETAVEAEKNCREDFRAGLQLAEAMSVPPFHQESLAAVVRVPACVEKEAAAEVARVMEAGSLLVQPQSRQRRKDCAWIQAFLSTFSFCCGLAFRRSLANAEQVRAEVSLVTCTLGDYEGRVGSTKFDGRSVQ